MPYKGRLDQDFHQHLGSVDIAATRVLLQGDFSNVHVSCKVADIQHMSISLHLHQTCP